MWQCHEENCSKKTLVITLIPNNTNAELVEHYHKPKLSDYLNNSNTKYDHHFVVNNQSETLFCNICQQIIRKNIYTEKISYKYVYNHIQYCLKKSQSQSQGIGRLVVCPIIFHVHIRVILL